MTIVSQKFKEQYRKVLSEMTNDDLWAEVLYNNKEYPQDRPLSEGGFMRIASVQEMDRRLKELKFLTVETEDNEQN